MKALVTGVAGFIGSHLAERLLRDGHSVTGIDTLSNYYSVEQKLSNVSLLKGLGLVFVHDDLSRLELLPYMEDADVVLHLAAQPGVRPSWGLFDIYVHNNVTCTQRVLEAARQAEVPRVIYSSSSSVYGNATLVPTPLGQSPAPFSPYGVTKLAGEHLVSLYGENYGLQTTSLRYFTVYGPRQRPDMAIHRIVSAALSGEHFTLYGDGSFVRDFTYVRDVVEANLAAIRSDNQPGSIFNVAGGSSTTMLDLIAVVEKIAGRKIDLRWAPTKAGDVTATGGDISRTSSMLNWVPKVDLSFGLEEQIAWHRTLLGSS